MQQARHRAASQGPSVSRPLAAAAGRIAPGCVLSVLSSPVGVAPGPGGGEVTACSTETVETALLGRDGCTAS